MKILKWIGTVLAIIVGLFVVVGLFLPSTYRVERSLRIDAPATVIFAQLNDLTRMEAWSPWAEADPTMETTYGEVTVGEGATSSWTSESAGSGTMTITESVPDEYIKVALDFGDMGTATGFWKLEEADGGVNTIWGFEGDVGWDIPGRYFGLGMDAMVGPFYEKGLANLKRVAEAAAAEAPADAVQPDEAASESGGAGAGAAAADEEAKEDATSEGEAG